MGCQGGLRDLAAWLYAPPSEMRASSPRAAFGSGLVVTVPSLAPKLQRWCELRSFPPPSLLTETLRQNPRAPRTLRCPVRTSSLSLTHACSEEVAGGRGGVAQGSQRPLVRHRMPPLDWPSCRRELADPAWIPVVVVDNK
jgi:hypothetical protein